MQLLLCLVTQSTCQRTSDRQSAIFGNQHYLIIVRTQCEPMHPHLCHRLSDSVCLSLVRVPESTVNWGSGFLGWGKGLFYSEGGVRKGVVFRNLGLFGQWCSAVVTKLLFKEFLKSCTFLFLLIPENVDTIC